MIIEGRNATIMFINRDTGEEIDLTGPCAPLLYVTKEVPISPDELRTLVENATLFEREVSQLYQAQRGTGARRASRRRHSAKMKRQ